MTGSVLATTAIINMIYNWNEFIFVNTFISSDMFKTLTVGVQNFIGQYTTDWGAIGATLMISILPILLMFLFLSDRIVEGIGWFGERLSFIELIHFRYKTNEPLQGDFLERLVLLNDVDSILGR